MIKIQDKFVTRGNRDSSVCVDANSWRATNNVMTIDVNGNVLLLPRKRN